MIRIVPFKREHLEKIKAAGTADFISSWINPGVVGELERNMSLTAIDGDEVLCVAGVVEYWEGRAAAWAMLADNIGRRFIPVHRAVNNFLDMCDYKRLEATTAVGFCNGHRWLEMLGFKLETERMAAYLPNGDDAAMYVRGI